MVKITFDLVLPYVFYCAKIDHYADLIRDAAYPEHDLIGVPMQIFAFTFISVQMMCSIKGKLLAYQYTAVMIFKLLQVNISPEFLKRVNDCEFTRCRAHDFTSSLRYLLRKIFMPDLLNLQAGHSPQPSPITPL
ncbi:hypothetical protein D3C73_1284950 [compost metagenome]